MPAALDDEAQAMGAGEIKCRGDVGCSLGSDDIGARDRTPGVQPAGALVQPRLAPEIKGIGEELSHRRISEIGQGDRRPPTARLRASHSAALGQPGMPGLAQLGATVAVGAARSAAAAPKRSRRFIAARSTHQKSAGSEALPLPGRSAAE